MSNHNNLLATGSDDRGILGFGSIPVAILTSCQYMQNTKYKVLGSLVEHSSADSKFPSSIPGLVSYRGHGL